MKQRNELIIDTCSRNLQLERWKVLKTVQFIEEGCSVPFIARYRRIETGELSAESIYEIKRSHEAQIALITTRDNRLQKLSEKGVDDESIRVAFHKCQTMKELDELWDLYKERKSSKAEKAKEIVGMESLALSLLNGSITTIQHQSIQLPNTVNFTVLEGIEAIITDIIAHNASNVKIAHNVLYSNIRVNTSLSSTVTEEVKRKSKYITYDNFDRAISQIASHQVLAIRRGKDSGELSMQMKPSEQSVNYLTQQFHSLYHIPKEFNIKQISNTTSERYTRTAIVATCISKGINKVISPMLSRRAWSDKLEQAEEDSLLTFSQNLKALLLTPSLSSFEPHVKVVAGLDPGYKNGHKFVVVAVGGTTVLARDKFYWGSPSGGSGGGGGGGGLGQSEDRRRDTLTRLKHHCETHKVDVIAIGDGTASREAMEMVDAAKLTGTKFTIVSEAGASVYSASPAATEEFPGEDISYLGSISIARRLVDPLSELVKIPPPSLGVGMYQHDINEKLLTKRLGEVVENCVSEVGADLNTASEHILKYVSGLNTKQAKAIVEYRTNNGPYTNRQSLTKVKGIGKVAYHNIAGFLRIRDGEEELDSTCVHPENYKLAKALLIKFGIGYGKTKNTLRSLRQALSVCDWTTLSTQLKQPEDTLRSIAMWLAQTPGGDGAEGDVRTKVGVPPVILNALPPPQEVIVNAVIEGTVKNLAAFGAFLDLGQSLTGLLHKSNGDISKLTVGQRLMVKVIDMDMERGRISLKPVLEPLIPGKVIISAIMKGPPNPVPIPSTVVRNFVSSVKNSVSSSSSSQYPTNTSNPTNCTSAISLDDSKYGNVKNISPIVPETDNRIIIGTTSSSTSTSTTSTAIGSTIKPKKSKKSKSSTEEAVVLADVSDNPISIAEVPKKKRKGSKVLIDPVEVEVEVAAPIIATTETEINFEQPKTLEKKKRKKKDISEDVVADIPDVKHSKINMGQSASDILSNKVKDNDTNISRKKKRKVELVTILDDDVTEEKLSHVVENSETSIITPPIVRKKSVRKRTKADSSVRDSVDIIDLVSP